MRSLGTKFVLLLHALSCSILARLSTPKPGTHVTGYAFTAQGNAGMQTLLHVLPNPARHVSRTGINSVSNINILLRSNYGTRTMLPSLLRLASVKGPVQSLMEQKLQNVLSPTFLEVVNESAAHKGHVGNPTPQLDETHFTVKIRSGKFCGKGLVQQHRMIYDVLKQELQEGVHALSICSSEPIPEDKQ